jgi:hypothetical protein
MRFLLDFEGTGVLRKRGEAGLEVDYKIEVYQEELSYKLGAYGRLQVFGRFSADTDRLLPYMNSEAILDMGNGMITEILVHGAPRRFHSQQTSAGNIALTHQPPQVHLPRPRL